MTAPAVISFDRVSPRAGAGRLLALVSLMAAGRPAPLPAQAPIRDIVYELRFDASTAAQSRLRVEMRFRVDGPEPVLLSLPAWTPGAYEISNFARKVLGFSASQDGRALGWDKADFDTWRVRPSGPGEVRVGFDYLADALDNAMAWARSDFLLVNGTNVFLYPEGMGFDFPARVRVVTEPGWRVATGMRPAGEPDTFAEADYHDLVDMPLFIGRLDYDSVMVDGVPYRLATYPAGSFTGADRRTFHDQVRRAVPPMVRVFGETPWAHYTTLLIFEPSFGGGSALEHQNSHVGIYNPGFIGTHILPSITLHEIIHAWNVKRLRPADLVPYRYDGPQPTVWLWVSEGVTDYYADLALARGGIADQELFLELLNEKLADTDAGPPVALEDASLSTWIQPVDGSAYVYYPKGALAGFLLDILIRDASDNRRSLDDVMRALYQRTWKAGRGFTAEDWWGAVEEAAGGRDFDGFAARYIDGREPFPWAETLPLAGFRLAVDSIREPRVGVITAGSDSAGTRIESVTPGGSADRAGLQAGDLLVRAGEVEATNPAWGAVFRARYAGSPEGTPITYVVRRGGRELGLEGRLGFDLRLERRIVADPQAPPRAARIRDGILRGDVR